ncbi:MAG TPA: (deoxy)nucleoside triphosphate pyrophosphohydrolase [Thermoanaerobaculia bacterium]|nr:(deoxy)nucleoside triphosphate pyrophosphohydrolase [Thermoanaerobaculia bacterium]HUM30511.1 (deoxy)nucleoside triphosphate pyrophosphohydrolase [Thermoanaerobaculia bacterium]HXK68703.1 (deoxy)nucleoside triphosphate pyrophosphohydrolase [Thermoanaerobaculia bacterium]
MILVAAGILSRGDTILLGRRLPGSHLAGLWEFPGGKIHTGETPREALDRELKEELGIDVVDAEPVTFSYYRYPEKEVLILFFQVTFRGEPASLHYEELCWVPIPELRTLPMPPADKPILSFLTGEKTRYPGP